MKKKVLIINSRMGGGDFFRALRIAESLDNFGYNVNIITWNRVNEERNSNFFNNSNVKVFNHRANNSIKSFLFLHYLFWWAFVISHILRDDYDTYHPQGLFSFFPVFLINFVERKKIIYDLIDFVADSFQWSESTRSLIAGIENHLLSYTEGVIVVDKDKQDINLGNVKRLSIVTNCPEDALPELIKFNTDDKFTIYYGGVIYENRGIWKVIESIEGMDRVQFVIAGTGPDEKKLFKSIAGRENVKYIGLINQMESLEWTYNSNLVIIFYDPSIRIHRKASPAKLYDALMCGTPVLVNQEAVPVANLVNIEQCGMVTSYFDIQGIRSSIQEIVDNKELARKFSINGREAFKREYNWKVMERRLIELYNDVYEKG